MENIACFIILEGVKKTKEWMKDTVKATILVGSARSPASLHVFGEMFSTKCIACNALGTHEHIYWGCSKVPEAIGKK